MTISLDLDGYWIKNLPTATFVEANLLLSIDATIADIAVKSFVMHAAVGSCFFLRSLV